LKTRPLLLLFALAALLPAASAHATIHVVNQTGLAFVPANLTIVSGDTVRWVWSAGIHTVTNGTTLADPGLASLFDSPLTTASRSFQFRFTAVGVVPYLCRPHSTLGMVGTVTVRAPTGLDNTPSTVPVLFQNTPNPFNPNTRIDFVVPATGARVPVRLQVLDARGRVLRTLLSGELAPGRQSVVWDGREDSGRVVASGVYACRLNAGGQATMRTMTLLK
jgi:plastocyanin